MTGNLCVHYRRNLGGKSEETCAAGHKYSEFVNLYKPGWWPKLPCNKTLHPDFPKAAICPDCRFPTADEIKKDNDEFFAQAGRMLEVLSVLKAGNYPRNSNGRIDCPICKSVGSLFFSVAHNGHIAAKCDTTECVNLIE